jgi:serine/threonine protein kinase
MADQPLHQQPHQAPQRPKIISVNTGASFTLGNDDNNDESDQPLSGTTNSPVVNEPPSAALSSLSSNSDMVTLRSTLRNRGTSISFSPQVKLDDGQKHDLEAPLPKPATLTHEHTAPVGKPSDLAEFFQQDADSQSSSMKDRRQRSNSVTETQEFDPVTGAPKGQEPKDSINYHTGEMRYPYLQSTVDELAQERVQRKSIAQPTTIPIRSASQRVFDSGSSQPLSIGVPAGRPTGRDYLRMTMSPSDYSPTTQNASGATNDIGSAILGSGPLLLRSRRSESSRSFGSMGSIGRRHASRSAANSSGPSPAQSFLNSWLRTEESRAPDPDEEGQHIGGDDGDYSMPTYIIGRKIGYGGYSVVREATTIENDRKVVRAVKIVRKQIKDKNENENEKLQAEFEGEVNVWRYLRHRCILPLIAVYETDFATFCITELHSAGTLFDLIRRHRKDVGLEKNRGLEPRLVKRYLWQLASAIRYLHEDFRVVHRDIKPENCLIDITDPRTKAQGGKVLLCDFGMADWVSDERRQTAMNEAPDLPGHSKQQKADGDLSHGHHVHGQIHPNVGPAQTSTNIYGSLEYCAPELLNAKDAVYSTEADMWAYGCTAYALVTCDRAFYHEFQPRLVMMIERGTPDEDRLERSLCANEGECEDGDRGEMMKDFLTRCFDMDPEARMTVGEALEHEWLEGARDIEEDEDELR